MANKKIRSIPVAVRELCHSFPETEEVESHGSPGFRARKGKFFAYFCVNHHGDGHVALWLNTPALEQSRLLNSSPHIFKPPYLGPSGWIGVELNRGFSWQRAIELTQMAYANSSPRKLVEKLGSPPAVAKPAVKMKPEEIDRLKAPRALKTLALLRNICLALPEASESVASGFVTWRAGKKGFASLYDYGKGLTASFWVGIERQGPLEMDPRFFIPPYQGHNGWMALDVAKGAAERELRDLVVESYRHFASRRSLAALDAALGH
jgi:predicted DNA-binding protein (MmcQ/YjbR family)